jgi:predicted phosphodiesterase
MQIHLLSDLHTEFRDRELKWMKKLARPCIDLAILAGDIANWRDRDSVKLLFQEISKLGKEVLYIPGNHEFYGTSPTDAIRLVNEIKDEGGCPDNLTVQTAPFAVYNFGDKKKQRVIGGTMWFGKGEVSNFASPDTGLMVKSGKQFSDFYWIKDLAPWVYEQNDFFTHMAESTIGPGDIVVTHHLPSYVCVDDEYRPFVSTNAFFVHEMGDVIEDRKPSFWMHGHTHSPVDHTLGSTRILANPYGYPGEHARSGRTYKPLVLKI